MKMQDDKQNDKIKAQKALIYLNSNNINKFSKLFHVIKFILTTTL